MQFEALARSGVSRIDNTASSTGANNDEVRQI